jgi:hypothetical protein
VSKIQEQQKAFPKYSDTWIGYMQSGGTFQAIDGSPVTYVNWPNAESPPPAADGEPQCAFINGQTGYWLLQSCPSTQGVVCRKPKVMGSSTTRKTTPGMQTGPTVSRHHLNFTLPPDSTTVASSGDSTWTILLIVGAVFGVISGVLMLLVLYYARTKPERMPAWSAWLVRIVGKSTDTSALVGDKETGVVNEVYEAAPTSSAKAEASSGIEGPAATEADSI